MKLTIIKSNLRDGLAAVERATGENQNLPILKNVLIDADDGKIRLVTTNLEIAVRCVVSGKVIEPGRLTVPANILAGVLGNLTGERLNLETKGAALHLTTDSYEATLEGTPPDDFPIIPKTKNQTEQIEIQGGILKEALTQTAASAQFSELRPELSSVLFLFSLNDLKLVATDSFRLSEKTIAGGRIRANTKQGFSALVPLKTAHELIRIIKDDETVHLYYDQNQILFTTERFELISRLIDGTFPDYTAILPKKFDTEVAIGRAELVNALKLAAVFSSRSGEVRIAVPENKKGLRIASAEHGVGENSNLIPAKITGGALEVGFNWRYLMDGLRALSTEEVLLGINEENKPAQLRAAGDATYFYVVMPILRT